jgi:hypothetical protein
LLAALAEKIRLDARIPFQFSLDLRKFWKDHGGILPHGPAVPFELLQQ